MPYTRTIPPTNQPNPTQPPKPPFPPPKTNPPTNQPPNPTRPPIPNTNPVTKIPFVGSVADAAYDLWAVNRLKLTGRPELEEILKERQAKIAATNYDECEDECEIKW